MCCSSSFQVITAGNDKYWIVRSAVKEAFTIMNANGEVIAEVSMFTISSSSVSIIRWLKNLILKITVILGGDCGEV